MSTIELQVTDNARDAHERADCATFAAHLNDMTIQSMGGPGFNRWSGMVQFEDVTIPPNATIDAADFRGYLNRNTVGGPVAGDFFLQAEDVGNSSTPLAQNDYCNRNWAGTQIGNPDGPWGSGNWLIWAMAEPIFDERVSHPDWVEGNRITLTIHGRDIDGPKTMYMATHNNSAELTARSTVDYTAGGDGGKIHDPVGVGATVVARG